jgi:hypothetical protein
VIADVGLTKERLKAFMDLPWVLPATMLMRITDEDLDILGSAGKEDYWRELAKIAERIEREDRR